MQVMQSDDKPVRPRTPKTEKPAQNAPASGEAAKPARAPRQPKAAADATAAKPAATAAAAPAARPGRGGAGGRPAAAAAPAAPAQAKQPALPPPPARLRERYMKTIVPTLMRDLGYKNTMQVPKLEKIIINVGIGREVTSSENSGKIVEATVKDITAIAGQKPMIKMSKKAIASFKLRKGQPVGVMVTLRGARMYEFFDKLINVTLPRIRDFQGSPVSSFDGRGAYQLGMREQTLFPEIEYTAIDRVRGLQINIVTTADSKESTKKLLESLGMPFVKEGAPARPRVAARA